MSQKYKIKANMYNIPNLLLLKGNELDTKNKTCREWFHCLTKL